jgi:hypothetical protein
MRLIHRGTGDAARQLAASQPPFGPALAADVVSRTETIEVWGSSFDDPGPDACEFRAFDASGNEIARTRIGGY